MLIVGCAFSVIFGRRESASLSFGLSCAAATTGTPKNAKAAKAAKKSLAVVPEEKIPLRSLRPLRSRTRALRRHVAPTDVKRRMRFMAKVLEIGRASCRERV